MKNAKFLWVVTFGLIIALFSGCFSPVSFMPFEAEEKASPSGQDDQPFTVDIYVNQEGARSVAGASSAAIKGGGLNNFVQLIVVDETDKIIAFDEVRKNSSKVDGAALQVEGLSYGPTYKFLILFGHWERDTAADMPDGSGGTILGYKEDAKPVLLAAGYKKQAVEGSGTVTVNMWPLVINTVFEAAGSQVQPVIGQPVDLLEDKDWQVKWTIGRNSDGTGNGVAALVEAGSAGVLPESILPDSMRKYIVNETETGDLLGNLTAVDNTLTASLEDYKEASHIGKSYPVNFYLEYVPFNLAEAGWSAYESVSKFSLENSPPVWVIRNGLNDKAQTNKTDFTKVGKADVADYKSYDGNGGILFRVKDVHEDGYYVKADGKDTNPGSYAEPFKTLKKAVGMAHNTTKPVIVIGTLTQANSGTFEAPHDGYSTFLIQEKNVTVQGHPGSHALLQATEGSGKRVLATSGNVTLKNIYLEGGNGQEEGAGIWVDSGTLTLGPAAWVRKNGSNATKRGGGVYVRSGATLNLEGGIITLNWTGTDTTWGGGGGLFVSGIANLKSGWITYNTSANDGGGVIVGGINSKTDYGVVKMYNGVEVSHNHALDDGGGIGVDYYGQFYMYGGIIKANASEHNGGGLRLEKGLVDVKAGAVIAGTNHSEPNWHVSTSYEGHAYKKYLAAGWDTTIIYGFAESYGL